MKFRYVFSGMIAMLVLAAAFVVVPLAIADPNPPGNVGICHRTGSESNPYVFIAVDNSAIREAHITSVTHPPLNGREDFLGTRDECKKG